MTSNNFNSTPTKDLKVMSYEGQYIPIIKPNPLAKIMKKKEKTDYTNYIQNIYPSNLYNPTDSQFPKEYFTKQNVENIQRLVAKLLDGMRDDKKRIIVSEENVLSVMQSIILNYPRTSVDNILLMTASMIANLIRNEYQTIKKNFSYNIDVLRYSGEYGIRQYPPIKILKKRLTSGWNYNY